MQDYRKPAIHEADHEFLYMTESQLRFYCSDTSGRKSFRSEDNDFYKYYCKCMAHNIFYDISEKEPDKCHIVWDHFHNAITYRAAADSIVWDKLKALGISI